MKKIHDISEFLENLFNTKPVSIAVSILCAILIWFAISVTAYKTTHATFDNIPVSLDLTGTPAEASGLSVVSCDVETINVELEGNRLQLYRLTDEDLHAYIQTGNINNAGEFYFEIVVEADKNISFTVTRVFPEHATVKLDRIETRTYDVTASFPNIRVTSGHALSKDDVVCEPSVIEITGPAAQLDEISRVEIFSDKDVEIDSMYSLYTNEVRLYTEEGALLDDESLEIPNVNFQITIPVLTQKELELTYDIRNAPSGFDLNWLKERLQLSEETITLASQTNTVFVNDTWSVGYIKLDEIGLDFSTDFIIDLDEEYINQSGFQQVSLTLDNEGLVSKEFRISGENIAVVNAPRNYDYDIVTRSMTVTIVGDSEELENLSTQDIIVNVDLLNYDISQSTSFTADATVSFYNESKLWAVGNYKVALNFTQQQTEAATTDTES